MNQKSKNYDPPAPQNNSGNNTVRNNQNRNNQNQTNQNQNNNQRQVRWNPPSQNPNQQRNQQYLNQDLNNGPNQDDGNYQYVGPNSYAQGILNNPPPAMRGSSYANLRTTMNGPLHNQRN